MPLEDGDVPPPDGRALFVNAGSHPFLPRLPSLTVWQPFRPLAAPLEFQNIQIVEDVRGVSGFRLSLVHIPKQVEEAKYLLAAGWSALASGGWLVAAAANDANGTRLEKWMAELGLEVSVRSKNKARVVFASRPSAPSDKASATAAQWLADGDVRVIDIGDGLQFKSQPGLFSWDRIDAGSRLLVDTLPSNLTGTGADFGAGIGYLSHQILKTAKGITSWHALEADSRALDCARENLSGVQAQRTVDYHWADLTKKQTALPPLDVIVMNPPFHAGKKTDAALGQDFIRTAHHHLKKGGRLFMVANTHLPYEQLLGSLFSCYRQLAQDKGFKILEAVR